MSDHQDEHDLIEDIIAEFRDAPASRSGPEGSPAAPEDDLEALLASVRAMTEDAPLVPEEAPSEPVPAEVQEPQAEAAPSGPPASAAPEQPSAAKENTPTESPRPATLEERLQARNITVETLDLSRPSPKKRQAPEAQNAKNAQNAQNAPEAPAAPEEPELLPLERRKKPKKAPLVFPKAPSAAQQAASGPEPSVPAEEPPEEPAAEHALPQEKGKKRRRKKAPEEEPEEEAPLQAVAWENEEAEERPEHADFDPELPPRRPLPYDLVNQPCEDPAQMAQKLRKKLGSMAARLLLTVVPAAVSVYLTGAVYRSWPLPAALTYTAIPGEYCLGLAGLLLIAMLLCHETVLSGLWRLVRGRPTLDSIAAVSCLLCLTDCLLPYFLPQWRQGLPCACVNIATLLFSQIAKRQRYEALRRNYKSIAMGASPMSVKLYSDGRVQDMAVKTQSGVEIEPEALSEHDFTERFACYYAPVMLVLAAALAFSASVGKGEPLRLIWSFSAILSAAAPMCLLLSSSAAAKTLGKKLYTSGSLLLNARKAGKLARCRSAALRDADLFPAGTVAITGMKAAEHQSPEELLGCTASLLQEVGGGLGKCFVDFARQQYIVPNKARELRFFDTRGICATVSGRYVQVGTANYLTRTGVPIAFGQKVKNNIFIAINAQFAGVFSLRYTAQPAVYGAFGLLKQARVRPVLALRDMLQTQSQIEALFDLKRSTTYLPELEERLNYSEASFGREEETLALLFRDGAMPLSETLCAAKKWKRAAFWGCLLGTLCALGGMMILAFLTGKGAFSAADPCNILLYLLLWSMPVKLVRGIITKN